MSRNKIPAVNSLHFYDNAESALLWKRKFSYMYLDGSIWQLDMQTDDFIMIAMHIWYFEWQSNYFEHFTTCESTDMLYVTGRNKVICHKPHGRHSIGDCIRHNVHVYLYQNDNRLWNFPNTKICCHWANAKNSCITSTHWVTWIESTHDNIT